MAMNLAQRTQSTSAVFILLASLLLMGACQPVPGTDAELQRAIDLYTGVAGTVDDAQAKRLLESAVAREETLAIMWLARVYSTGRMGFPADKAQAQSIAAGVIDDIAQLAAAGNPEAKFLMGTAFAEGLGKAQNPELAVQWYRRAAADAHVLAQHNLGNVYFSGTGVEQSDAMAVYWWTLAAEQGDAIPQFRLAEMLEQGRGTARDAEAALRWYRKAAAKGNVNARAALARLEPG
ncbi:MAG: tetratricopeptide repeat protein [Pseudomonadales bacterium]|nr:tetratricopeptide repeat protein [Pseudomonadales bacterium]